MKTIRQISCDVLVVGAGPGGSQAALAAARGGAYTVLIDAKVRIGEQPHCGEYIPAPMLSECEFDRECLIQAVTGMETIILGGESLRDDEEHQKSLREIVARGFIIDRVKFDRLLARQAAAAGALVYSGTRIFRRDGDQWLARSGAQTIAFHPKYIIAADGAVSTVARLLGLSQHKFLRGVQMEVPLSRAINTTKVYLHQSLVGGYGWLFPKGNVANLGLGISCESRISPRQLLMALNERLVRGGIIRPGWLAWSGGLIGVSGMRERLVIGNVLFCGDAAGLTHPITGAGIPQAVISGKLAGACAVDALKAKYVKALAEYESEIRGRFQGVLEHARAKRVFMEGRWQNQDFDRLCKETWIAFPGYRRRVRQ